VVDRLQLCKLTYVDRGYTSVSSVPGALLNQIDIETKRTDRGTTTPAAFLIFDANDKVVVFA